MAQKKFEDVEDDFGTESNEGQKEVKGGYLPKGSKLEREVTAVFFNKKDLLDKEIVVTIKTLGTNRWGKYELFFVYQSEERSIVINKKQYNWLLDAFGDDLNEWEGKQLKIAGKYFAGDIEKEIDEGVTLVLSLV